MTYINHDEPYSDDYLQDILKSVKTIAMVGASPDQTKFSYGVNIPKQRLPARPGPH